MALYDLESTWRRRSGIPKDKQVMVKTQHIQMHQMKNWRWALFFNNHLQWREMRQGILKTLMFFLVPNTKFPLVGSFLCLQSHISISGACAKTMN